MRLDPLSVTFSALADPTRRAILARLAEGEASIGELAKPFDLSLPTVSRHIKVLEAANLIIRRTDAQWRRCALRSRALRDAAEWIERYRAYWEGRLDALAHYVVGTGSTGKASKTKVKSGGQPKAKPKGKIRRSSKRDKRR